MFKRGHFGFFQSGFEPELFELELMERRGGRPGGPGHPHGHPHGKGRHGGGRHPGGYFGEHGGRVFKTGDLRLILLSLIAEQPRYGYELIKAIEQIFGGTYAPSPGSIYPTLTLLEEIGHIQAVDSEAAKKQFKITEEGLAYLKEYQVQVDAATARMGMLARARAGKHAPDAVFEAMSTLKMSLSLHQGNWTPEETQRVAKIIQQAAFDIEQKENT